MKQYLGLSYVYENGTETQLSREKSSGLSSESLRLEIAGLPKNIVKDFQTAAELSDMEQMDHLVAQIRTTNKALAQVFAEYIDTFQYDKILILLDKEARAIKPDHQEHL